MSYTVSVSGYGFMREALEDGDLSDVLENFDVKYTSFAGVAGDFVHKLADRKYKEVDGGTWTWVIYWQDGGGRPKGNGRTGVNYIDPDPGDRVMFNYVFIPSSKAPEQEVGYVADFGQPEPEEGPIEYDFESSEDYELPDYFGYELDEPEEVKPADYLYEDVKLPAISYAAPMLSIPRLQFPRTVYSTAVPSPAHSPTPSFLPEYRFQADLESFLMDVLAGARFESLIDTARAPGVPAVIDVPIALPQQV